MNWRCHSLRWSSMTWAFIQVHRIGHARPIGCRWNMHFIAHIQPTYTWNPHLASWSHEVHFYKYYLKDSGTRGGTNRFFFVFFVFGVNYLKKIELDTHFCKSWLWHLNSPIFSRQIKYFVYGNSRDRSVFGKSTLTTWGNVSLFGNHLSTPKYI